MSKVFTLAEASELLPTLQPLLEQLRSLRADSRRQDDELQRMIWKARGNGHDGLDTALTSAQRNRERGLNAIGDIMDRIHAMGVQVKDQDAGLVDFPSLRTGRLVLLCWKLGEDAVEWWHELEAGFAGRQRLDA